MPQLQSYLQSRPRYGIGASAVPWSAELPAYIRITDIDQYGRFRPDPAVSVADPMAINYYLVDGDLVVARTGASVGKSYRYRPVDGDLVFAGFLMSVRPNPDVLDPVYLSCIFQSKEYWDWITAESMRSGQPGVNAQQLAQFEIHPPCIEEQHAIAESIQRADDFLDALERLIAKKRDVKQGMMQELLTGRTRLPGFTGDWREVELGQLGVFLKGRGVSRDQVRSSGVPCIRYGELYTTYHNYARQTVSYVDPDVAMTALQIRPGDLLFAGSGETKTEIGMTVAYAGESAAVAGGDIIVLRGTGFDPIFVGSLLNTPALAAQKASRGQGDAVVHIGAGALSTLRFRLPAHNEQHAIAEVLQDADAEIEALERRLDSARAVKAGMMQELLMGQTRLTVKEKA